MLKDILRSSLRAFTGGFLAAFFFLLIEKDFTWPNFTLAFCLAVVISVIFGVAKTLIVKKSKEELEIKKHD